MATLDASHQRRAGSQTSTEPTLSGTRWNWRLLGRTKSVGRGSFAMPSQRSGNTPTRPTIGIVPTGRSLRGGQISSAISTWPSGASFTTSKFSSSSPSWWCLWLTTGLIASTPYLSQPWVQPCPALLCLSCGIVGCWSRYNSTPTMATMSYSSS